MLKNVNTKVLMLLLVCLVIEYSKIRSCNKMKSMRIKKGKSEECMENGLAYLF